MSEVVVQRVDGLLVPVIADQAGASRLQRRPRNELGMVSAEWAVGLIAAIGIAGVLLAVVTNGAVKKALLDFILAVTHGQPSSQHERCRVGCSSQPSLQPSRSFQDGWATG